MYVSLDDVVERTIFLAGVYEWTTVQLFRRLVLPGMTVLDVGAHVGQYTLLAGRLVGAGGRVIAFEPNPITFEVLSRNVSANNMPQVELARVALGDSAGTRQLRVPRGHPATGTLLDANPTRSVEAFATDRFDTSVQTLDRIIRASGLARLDVIKIDVEGLEAAVMIGGEASIRHWLPAIIFEANQLTESLADLLPVKFLHSLGYRLFGYLPTKAGIDLIDLASAYDAELLREQYSINLLGLHPMAPLMRSLHLEWPPTRIP